MCATKGSKHCHSKATTEQTTARSASWLPRKESGGFVVSSKGDTADIWFSGKKMMKKIVAGG